MYKAIVTQLWNTVDIKDSKYIKYASINGEWTIISKNWSKEQIGLYFPEGSQLSVEYLHENNLYIDPTLNKYKDMTGCFDKNGMVDNISSNGYTSKGFFMPIASLMPFETIMKLSRLKVGDKISEVNGVMICR